VDWIQAATPDGQIKKWKRRFYVCGNLQEGHYCSMGQCSSLSSSLISIGVEDHTVGLPREAQASIMAEVFDDNQGCLNLATGTDPRLTSGTKYFHVK
jgi:hypothetical protein